MSKQFILLITGPAGVGKTTISKQLAGKQDSPTVHIPLDEVRRFIRSPQAHHDKGWNDLAQEQYDLTQKAIRLLVDFYLKNGFNIIIDDAIFPEWEAVNYQKWQEILKDLDHKLVILRADEEVLLERNRAEDRHNLDNQMVKTISQMMASWKNQSEYKVINTTSLTIEEVVEELEKEIT